MHRSGVSQVGAIRGLRASAAPLLAAFIAATAFAPSRGLAQDAKPEPRQEQPSVRADDGPATGGVAAHRPGFLDAFGRWVSHSISSFKFGVGVAGDTAGQAATGAAQAVGGAAKGAADTASAVARGAASLTGSSIVEGRERCSLAANGAPDCRTAATKICQGKGFQEGSSIDLQSARNCPVRIYLSGRQPLPGECAIEHFVVRAMCQ